MERREYIELFVTIAFFIIVVFMCDPMLYVMPVGMQKGLVFVMLILFGLFAGTLWHERPRDEREAVHAHVAGRVGYFAGVAVLVVGITYQALMEKVDIWLPVALLAMIAGKLSARLYMRRSH